MFNWSAFLHLLKVRRWSPRQGHFYLSLPKVRCVFLFACFFLFRHCAVSIKHYDNCFLLIYVLAVFYADVIRSVFAGGFLFGFVITFYTHTRLLFDFHLLSNILRWQRSLRGAILAQVVYLQWVHTLYGKTCQKLVLRSTTTIDHSAYHLPLWHFRVRTDPGKSWNLKSNFSALESQWN